jgi:putative heme-binding domain-containing protein
MKPAERDELVKQLAQMARAPATQQLLAERLRDAEASREARQTVLRAMAQSGLREAPEAWITALIPVLASADAEMLREAVATAQALHAPKAQAAKLADALRPIGGNEKVAATVRLGALAAMPGGPGKIEPALFTFLRGQLAPEQPVVQRTVAADVLGKAKLTSEQLLAVAEVLKSAGPMEADRLLDAFGSSADEKVGRALVAALRESPARANLRVESLRPRLAKFGPAVQKQAEELYAALEADTAKQKAKLEELLATLKDGDIRRGQAVFNSQKAACSACHAIGYLGGKVGPDLTRIGGIRNERDLLESIVFPSASLVRSYESVLVATKDGKTHNGLIRQDAADEIVLATGVNQEVRIARADIEEMQPGQVSIMPAGLDQQLTPGELADLVAFLKACK